MTMGRGLVAVLVAAAPSFFAFVAMAHADDVTIGMIASMTGVAAAYDRAVVEGAEAYIKLWNDEGGFKGRHVELEVLDDESVPTTAVNVYRKLVDDSRIHVIFAAAPGQTMLAIKAVADDYGVPAIGSSTTVQLAKPVAKYFFRSLPGTDAYMDALVAWAKRRGYQKIATINPIDSGGQGEAYEFKRAAAANHLVVVAAETYSNTDTNFIAQLVKVRNAKPDFLYLGIIGGPTVTIFKQAKQLHLAMPIGIHSSAFNNNFFSGIGGRDKAEGVYTPVERGGLGSNAPGIAGKLYADASRLLGHPATNLNTAGWDTAMLIRHAYETSDDTRRGMRDAIENTKDLSVIGGFISYTPTDHGGKDARDVVVAQWHDGHFVDAN